MRVLGIDPGLTRCGLGVVDGSPGRPPTLVGVGVTRTPASSQLTVDSRRRAAPSSSGGATSASRPSAMTPTRSASSAASSR